MIIRYSAKEPKEKWGKDAPTIKKITEKARKKVLARAEEIKREAHERAKEKIPFLFSEEKRIKEIFWQEKEEYLVLFFIEYMKYWKKFFIEEFGDASIKK